VEQPVVLIDSGKIVSIQASGPAPEGAEVIDLGEAHLVPGMIDAHLHLCFDASFDPVGALAARSDDEALAQMREAARSALLAGITTVRDLGDRDYLAIRLRDQHDDLPTILAAGPPITSTKGHCWFLGGETEGVQGIRAAVQERAARGADVIKVMATGGELTEGTYPHLPQFSLEELKAAADEAHRLGLPITAHAHGVPGIVNAIDAGFDSIEHCSFMTKDSAEADPVLLAKLAASPTVVSATLGHIPVPGLEPPPRIKMLLAKLTEIFQAAAEARVKMIVSSDAGIAPVKPHNALAYSALHFTELGRTNLEALIGVTSGAADLCRVGERKGRLAPGYDADILAVQGDPLVDITALRNVVAVFKDGRLVHNQ
jgi:imidazolonepropionase-like amidohydrolase